MNDVAKDFFVDYGEPISGYRKPDVSAYKYISRSTRPENQTVKAFFNGILNEYDLEDKQAVLSKIQSHDDLNFQSTILELCVFAAIGTFGCKVVAAEPDGFSEKGRPDYLCYKGDKSFLIEVKNLTEHSTSERSAVKRFAVLKDRINNLGITDYLVDLDIEKYPDKNLPTKKIVKEVEEWVAGVSYENLVADIERDSWRARKKYEYTWPKGDPYFRLSLIPKKESARKKKAEQTIGAESIAKWSGARERIRKALKDKASKYGNLSLPYYIVINVDDFMADTDDFYDALFGSGAVEVEREGDKYSYRQVRNSDGLFGTLEKPTYTRVSGIFFVQGLNAFSVGSRKVTFVPHPAAESQVSSFAFYRRFHSSEIPVRGSGTASLATLFGLSQNWPN